MYAMAKHIRRLMDDENGATAIEYALIASLMGLALLPVMTNLSSAITSVYGQIAGFFALV